MKKFFKRIDKRKFFFIFLFFLSLHSFTPRDEKIFAQNSLRFLKNGEYKLLESYFLKYFSQVHANNPSKQTSTAKKRPYIVTIAVEIPLPSVKKNILLHSLEVDPTLKELHCYLGEQFLFEKEYEQAETHYQLCPSKKRFFYLAQIAEKQNEKEKAVSLYEKMLATPFEAELKSETAINLSHLHLELGNYQKSLSLAKKIKPGVMRFISLFNVYQAMKEEKMMEKTLEKIKKDYATTLEAKAFLNHLEEAGKETKKTSKP